jgi:hypothetical protein
MKLTTLLSSILALTTCALASPVNLAKRDFGPVTIFTPPSTYTNERTLYGRQLELKVGDVSAQAFATSELKLIRFVPSVDHGNALDDVGKLHSRQAILPHLPIERPWSDLDRDLSSSRPG